MGVTIWAVIAVVAALVLLAGAVVGIRRPRHAEDELGQPERQPAHIETPGSAGQAPLSLYLRSIQSKRGTGTVLVTSTGGTGSLYFLFGHLFHAVCGTSTGEDALRELLGWNDAQYSFDTKSPLPTEETIERPIDQILA
jgi:hypothetical protein